MLLLSSFVLEMLLSFAVMDCYATHPSSCYLKETNALNCIHTKWCPIVHGMTLNCIHIFIVTGSFLYWCVMRLASQRFFIHICIYLRSLIISYLATFLGLIAFLCWCAVKQSINQSHLIMMILFLVTTRKGVKIRKEYGLLNQNGKYFIVYFILISVRNN